MKTNRVLQVESKLYKRKIELVHRSSFLQREMKFEDYLRCDTREIREVDEEEEEEEE